MKYTYLLVLLFACIVWCDKRVRKKPTVLIEILVRNKAHTLPYFLTFLERLDYPKNRVSLWIRSDNNIDNSINIIEEWLNNTGHSYHMLDVKLDNISRGFENEKGLADWSADRFAHVINLREEALRRAKEIWADFIWVLDADVFLTNPKTLDYLISQDAPVVAPLLKSDGLYSNFWAGMSSDYYYLRSERYDPILHGEEKGCFEVPMVHSAVLIDLRIFDTDHLTYRAKNLLDYDGPDDDIISFAMSANKSGIPLTLCNEESFGFVMVPIQNKQTLSDDVQRLTNLKMEILNQENHLPLSKLLQKYVKYAEPDTLQLENIFMINLLRRPERRVRMQKFFKELGIKAEIIDAVDGRKLDENALIDWGIKMMPEYADPYHKRPMTMGEVGCFLSHYVIWNEILDRDYQKVMVLEDDVRFEIFFRQKIEFLLWELERLGISWDLVYLGRKKLLEGDEPYVEDSEHLVYAKYSYWTLGYLISASGAEKLVAAEPLKKLLPVDEYIPLLSDVHPRDDWKQHYPERNLVTLSVNPLLIHPTHYTGEKGYISDTENSKIISDDFISNDQSQTREEL